METVEFKRIDTAMSHDGIEDIRERIACVAPRPGALVLVKNAIFRLPKQAVDSVLLQAIDVRTQLLMGRFYYVVSLAAKMDFVEYVASQFPFFLEEICTDDSGSSDGTSEHRIALLASRLGIRHSITRFSDNGLLAYTNRHFFHLPSAAVRWKSIDDATTDFGAFMFRHNNERGLEIHHGSTPAEALRDLVGSPLPFNPT